MMGMPWAASAVSRWESGVDPTDEYRPAIERVIGEIEPAPAPVVVSRSEAVSPKAQQGSTGGMRVKTRGNSNHTPHFEYWWEALCALPPEKNSRAYQRLERVWRDQTRPSMDKTSGRRGHEFTNPDHETHLTVSLWENWSLFPKATWLPLIWRLSGLTSNLDVPFALNWSYEWSPGPRLPHCDIVVEYEDASGRGILVVEAKRMGRSLPEGKDRRPSYYLSLEQFASYERRSLIYLLDAAVAEEARALVEGDGLDWGILTWQDLAVAQMETALNSGLPQEICAYLAASIRRDFIARGVQVPMPPLPYLNSEPSSEEVVSKRAVPLGSDDWVRELWRIDGRGQ